MNKNKKNIFFNLLSFGELKLTLGYKLYCNFLYSIIGSIGWLFNFKETVKSFWFFIIFSCLSFVDYGCTADGSLYLRPLHLLSLVGLGGVAQKYLNRARLKNILKLELGIAIIIFIVEILTQHHFEEPKKIFKSLKLIQYYGLVGEPNFSSLAYMTGVVLSYSVQWILGGVLFSLLIFTTASKGSIVALVIFYLGRLFPVKFYKRMGSTVIGLVLSYPFIVRLLYLFHLNNLGQLVWLEEKSSARFILHNAYLDMGLKHWLGVGYFQGPIYLHEVYGRFMPVAEIVYKKIDFLEQHNLCLQILSEGGPISYGFFIIYLFSVLTKHAAEKPKVCWALACFFVNTVFLNALSASGLYLLLGYFQSQAEKDVQS